MRSTRSDAVSVYTQVKMEEVPRLLGFTRIRMSNELVPSTENPPLKVLGHHPRSSGSNRKKCVRTSAHRANTCTVPVEIWVMDVPTMPLHLGPSALPLTITLPPVGFIITLTHPRMAVTTSLRSWNDCNAFEQTQRRFPKMGVSFVFTIGVVVFIVHLTRTFGCFVCSCSQLSSFHLSSCFPEQVMESFSSSASAVPSLTILSHTTCGLLCWSCFSSSRLAAFSHPSLLKMTWPRSHSLVTLLLIYSVTKSVRMILHDASSGTIAHGVLFCGIVISSWVTPSLRNVAPILLRWSPVA